MPRAQPTSTISDPFPLPLEPSRSRSRTATGGSGSGSNGNGSRSRQRTLSSSTSFHPRRRSSTVNSGTTFGSIEQDGHSWSGTGSMDDEGEEEEWEGGPGSEFLRASPTSTSGRGMRRKKKDEPMSPVAVVLYVVFFYLIWQLLTRSTDSEILSHLSPSSPSHLHLLSHSPELGISSGQSSAYQLPYHLPHIPSPIPPSSHSEAGSSSPSTLRIALGIAMYPLYIIITLLATPLPLLLNALHLVLSLLATVLYPMTITLRILSRTFLVVPARWMGAVVSAFYPVYVFVGGVVGVGCVMGVGVGWAGSKGLEWVVGGKRSRTRGKKRSKSRSESRLSGTTVRSSERQREEPNTSSRSRHPEVRLDDPDYPSYGTAERRPSLSHNRSSRSDTNRNNHTAGTGTGSDSPANPRTPLGPLRRRSILFEDPLEEPIPVSTDKKLNARLADGREFIRRARAAQGHDQGQDKSWSGEIMDGQGLGHGHGHGQGQVVGTRRRGIFPRERDL